MSQAVRGPGFLSEWTATECGGVDKVNPFVGHGELQQIINEVKLVPEGIAW